jgi:hypothetical protein
VNGLYVDVGDAVALVQEAQRSYAVVARWAHAMAVVHAAAASN